MDIAAMSMGLSQIKASNAVGAAMLGNIKDVMKQQGNDLVRLMESSKIEHSVTPHKGGNVDIKL